jgi:phosphinothricin acetyltransferase
MTDAIIRPATERDAAGCVAVYAPYVRDTVISLEAEPPSVPEMADRIAAANRGHAWFVLEEAGRVAGYAYGSRFHTRAAYRWSCEVSVYLEMGRRRTGAGRALYERLFERLVERGYRTAAAAMTLPNEASAGLHTALGFAQVGVHSRIGWKYGAWHDVALFQRPLTAGEDPPAEPA